MQATHITAAKALHPGKGGPAGQMPVGVEKAGDLRVSPTGQTLRSRKHRNFHMVVTCFTPLPHSENCNPENGLGPWVCLPGEKEDNAGERGPA